MGGSSSILLTGAQGMLGRAWRQRLQVEQRHADAHDSTTLDLTSRRSIDRTIREHHRLVINCAAYTNVDGAESDPDEARAVNATAVAHLAARCREIDALLVHYSTDYVFDGTATTPYPVDAPINPINTYGRTKAEGEQAIRESGCPHLIIRTSSLFAPWGTNFVLTMMRLLSERPHLRVVNDQHARPTSCATLAEWSSALIHAGCRGTYHVAGGGVCTWHRLAIEIARLTHAACRVEPCSTAEFPRPAARPPYSVLDISQTEQATRPLPHWQQQVAATLAHSDLYARGGLP